MTSERRLQAGASNQPLLNLATLIQIDLLSKEQLNESISHIQSDLDVLLLQVFPSHGFVILGFPILKYRRLKCFLVPGCG